MAVCAFAASAEVDRDDPRARIEATREWRGDFAASVVPAAQRERDRYGIGVWRQSRIFGAVQGSTFINIGPTTADYEFNGGQYDEVDSGRARQVVPHPWNKDILYMATAGGGVWKSYDAGLGWEPITDALGTTAVGALAMDPSNPDVLYLGFGDPFDVHQPGLVRSTDGGATWSAPVALDSSAGASGVVTDIKVDPANSALVLAATDVGLFRSTDAGASFQPVALATPNAAETFFWVWSVAWTGGTTWLATGEVADPAQPTSASKNVGHLALWRSADDGATWAWNGGALPGGDAEAALMGRATLAVAPSTTGDAATTRVFLLAAALKGDETWDVFRSDDGGLDFLAVGLNANAAPVNPNSDQPDLDVLHQQAWYNQAIAVDPRNPDVLFVGGDLSLVSSNDGGVTWSVATNWLSEVQGLQLPYVHADLHSLAFGADGTLYAGSDGGLGISHDSGATFTSLANQGLVTHLAYSVACAPETWPAGLQGFVAGGLQDNGTRMRSGSSTTFDQILGGDGIGVAVSGDTQAGSSGAQVPKVLLATQPGRLLLSTDGGSPTSWVKFTNGMGTDALPFFVRLARDSANADPQTFLTYTATPPKVYRSSGGAAWQDISGTLSWRDAGTFTSGFVTPNNAPVALRNIAAHGVSAGVYGAVSNKYAYVTSDGGVNWQVSNPPAPAGAAAGVTAYLLSSIAFDPSDATGNTYYVSSVATRLTDGTSYLPLPQSFGHLYKTSDGGAHWTPLGTQDPNAGGLPFVPVDVVAVDPGSPATVYAGTDVGLYRSLDGGATWARFGAGSLPLVAVNDICISPGSSRLTVATYGRGFWQIGTGSTTNPAGVRGDGDTNFDQRIDGLDLIDLADAYGATQASAAYRWQADLAGTVNAIDADDVAALLAKFGGQP